MSEHLERPTIEDRAAWKTYWEAQGMPWRTEPETAAERQRYLTTRRAIKPNIEQGVYPFKDIRLTRADVEWLLETHESGGMRGPVDWLDMKQWNREGLDLRGADLRGIDLRRLPLASMRGGLGLEKGLVATVQQTELAAAHMDGVNLYSTGLQRTALNGAYLRNAQLAYARLQRANLSQTHLEHANLRAAHLEEAYLVGTHLDGADLRAAFLDSTAHIERVTLGNPKDGVACIADVRWGGVNMASVPWSQVGILGDELNARRRQNSDGRRKDDATRLAEHEVAVRANRQLATALRIQGLNEDADRFAFRAQMLQRGVLRRQRQWLRWLGSLFLDLISGYGYKPLRSFLTYLLVVVGFALAYFALGTPGGHPLTWNEALVVSLTAFHGRGFFASAFQPGDPQAAVAAVEAVVGLLIEITFIATFTQRFFAR